MAMNGIQDCQKSESAHDANQLIGIEKRRRKDYQAAYREAHKEQSAAYQKEYRESHKAEAKEYYKEFTHSPDIHFTIIKQTNEIVFEFKK